MYRDAPAKPKQSPVLRQVGVVGLTILFWLLLLATAVA